MAIDQLKRNYFLKHLFTSIVIITLITFLCVLIWFPSPFLLLDGTWFALLLMAAIDIIIGPMLTLLLVSSKKTKREIIFDMALILTIQIGALSYGLFQITQERVFAIVHSSGAFHLVPHKEISPNRQNISYQFIKYKNAYVAMILDSDSIEHSKTSDIHLLYSPEKYKAIQQSEISKTMLSYESLPKEIKEKYNAKYLFKILIGKSRNAVVILNENMDLVEIAILPKLI